MRLQGCIDGLEGYTDGSRNALIFGYSSYKKDRSESLCEESEQAGCCTYTTLTERIVFSVMLCMKGFTLSLEYCTCP